MTEITEIAARENTRQSREIQLSKWTLGWPTVRRVGPQVPSGASDGALTRRLSKLRDGDRKRFQGQGRSGKSCPRAVRTEVADACFAE